MSLHKLRIADNSAVFLVARHYRRDGRLVTEPRNATKFVDMSIIEPE